MTSRHSIISPSSGEQNGGRNLLMKNSVDLVGTPTLTVVGKGENPNSNNSI